MTSEGNLAVFCNKKLGLLKSKEYPSLLKMLSLLFKLHKLDKYLRRTASSLSGTFGHLFVRLDDGI